MPALHPKTMKRCILSTLILLVCLPLCFSGCSSYNSEQPQEETTVQISPENPETWLPELTVEEVDYTEMTVVFQPKDGCVVMAGNDYFLQLHQNGQWTDLPMLDSDPVFVTSIYDASNIRRHVIDWEWLYGTLTGGTYRLGKSVTLRLEDGTGITETVYAEFYLEPAQTEPTETETPAD